VAILPYKNTDESLPKLYGKLNPKLNVEMDTENIKCVLWEKIEKFFNQDSTKNDVIENFEYNKNKNNRPNLLRV